MTAEIFDILENTVPGAGGEIQLTDAMGELARRSGMTAVDFEGERFDFGSKLGFLTANVKAGIHHPEVGEDFRKFLIDFVKTL
jgi:UTP--glucose-1-phosphate uridylyltransferase